MLTEVFRQTMSDIMQRVLGSIPVFLSSSSNAVNAPFLTLLCSTRTVP